VRRNAIALVALFVALGGVAYAGSLAPNNSVDSGAIVNNSVKSKDVKDGNLQGKDVKDGTLGVPDLGPVVTGSFDLGSIPGNDCVSSGENIGVAGADDQDTWLVTPVGSGIPETNFDQAGDLFMVPITHSGEGHIKVCNNSAGAINPGSVSYRAVLINH
jgi:hypothetical protein